MNASQAAVQRRPHHWFLPARDAYFRLPANWKKKLLGFLNMPRHRQPRTGRGVSQRQLRVGELVRHVLADMLARGEVHDPVIQSHLITIPEVRMTADLRLATIYAMPLGGHDIDAVLAALNRNSRFLRGEIARRVNLKFAPDIRFAIDERFDEAERIEKLLRTPAVQRDLHNKSDDQS